MTPVENRDLGFDPSEYNTDPVEKAYRDALADGLELVLDAGADTLADVVAALNARSVCGPGGKSWTEEMLASELNRLGR
jgi:hypothetical protein